MATILNNIKQSCISISYYKKIIRKPFLDSFLSLGLVLLFLGISSGLYTSFTQIPKVSENLEAITNDIVTHYPDDLVFDLNNNTLDFNRESLTVPFSSLINKELVISFPFENFAYFTKTDLNLDTLNDYSTKYFIVINQDKIFISDPANPTIWQEYTLGEIFTNTGETKTTKDTIKNLNLELINWKNNNFTKIQVFTTFIITIGYIIAKIWFLLVETLLVVLIFKLYSFKITVKQTILLTMNILIPVSILTFISDIIYQDINLPMQTISFWILIMYFMFSFRKINEVKLK